MSLKNYFDIAQQVNSVSGLTGKQVGGEVESVGYHDEDIAKERRFIPRIDFSKPENFARYGLATEYYDTAIKRIYQTYPYDGSRRERLEWENESLDIDLYIYENLYPRTNGYIIFIQKNKYFYVLLLVLLYIIVLVVTYYFYYYKYYY